MRLASWNVNSIRARFELVVEWLREHQPDALCLQETKVADHEFPTETFQRLGFPLAQQVRVHPVARGDLGQRLFFLQHFQHDGGFLGGRVAFADHGRSVP